MHLKRTITRACQASANDTLGCGAAAQAPMLDAMRTAQRAARGASAMRSSRFSNPNTQTLSRSLLRPTDASGVTLEAASWGEHAPQPTLPSWVTALLHPLVGRGGRRWRG